VKPRILLLEDDPYVAQPYCDALRDEGFEVEYFERTDDAVARSRNCDFDVAILDLRVTPGESFDNVSTAGGFETGLVFARELRSRHPRIGIVLISGEDSNTAREWCVKNNAHFYWKAQLNRDDFVTAVTSLAQNAITQKLGPVLGLLNRFHDIAKKLESRYDGRPTLRIEDEYDVQDLLNALLLTQFSDIRAEEWVPSYAGGTSRVDFLIPESRLVIEVKVVTPKLRDKRVGEQLVIDCARYRGLPHCDTLLCFIYDADHGLKNAAGLKRDIEALSCDDLSVVVTIHP
jgi:ActR/RegA family two-component response regulator